MAGHQVYVLGRDVDADIQLTHETVSRLHAELVIGSDGSLFLADRSSSGGTYLRTDGGWESVSSVSLREGDKLRFGQFEVNVRELLRYTDEPEPSDAHELPSGRVRRDPSSGEIVPK